MTNERPLTEPVRVPVTECLACGTATHGGKDYCVQHVDRMPYAAEVRACVDETERELAKVAALEEAGQDGADAVNVFGVVAQDVVHMARQEPVTMARVGKSVCGLYWTGPEVVAAYVRALKAAGMVRTRPSLTGRRTLWLEAV